ncbi:translation initiation factor IF-2 isoform X2 [Cololabis saira]|uniref:translation initiation factor IF-2 isoform X2 n=1 Tax=Cololabis saira TaxID=129043 RepID=UPI002AD2D170|nr:translation initiation factor IF-2 isoform X2 [Cololabis saira]
MLNSFSPSGWDVWDFCKGISMNSLVGYGVSSDSDSDGDENNTKADCIETSAAQKTRNFLLESGSASSDSEPEDAGPKPPAPAPRLQATRPAPSKAPPSTHHNPGKLPSPSLNASSDSGVFANPFKARAEQQLSALQKHVPLTTRSRPAQIGGKKMCVSYRKDGRCRFGIKCKFAHDSDLQTTGESQYPPAGGEAPEPGPAEGGGSQNKNQAEPDGQQAKKRRVGLSNTLIPPKRALKQYAMLRSKGQMNMS